MRPDTMTANGAGVSGVLQALTRILEHAHAMVAEGYSPHVAIVAALDAHRPSLALARVARAAWTLALHEDGDASTTAYSTAQGSE